MHIFKGKNLFKNPKYLLQYGSKLPLNLSGWWLKPSEVWIPCEHAAAEANEHLMLTHLWNGLLDGLRWLRSGIGHRRGPVKVLKAGGVGAERQ